MDKQSLSLSGQLQFCCFCQTRSPYIESYSGTPIESIQILSLRFDSLEQAGELRYQEQQQEQSGKSRGNGKRKASGSETAFPTPSPPSSEGNLLGLVSADDIDMDKKTLAAAVPFLGIAHHGNGRTSSVKNEHLRTLSSMSSSSAPSYRAANIDHRRRTGRWTAAETAYVDYIVECFEAGTLPLPQGVKLNEFLSDALMCKPSRLTKKMKSAKLSMRSFAFGNWTVDDGSDVAKCAELSKLEGEFLNSINSEYLRLEAKFNLQRMWRTHFWNLCLQLGFTSLDIATEWLPSLEEMELRGGQAEEEVRRAERRRMGLALKQDARSSCGLSGVFIGGIPGAEGAEAQSRGLIMDSHLTETDPSPAPQAAFSSTVDSAKSNWLSFGASGGRPRSDSTTIPVSRSRSGSIAAPSFPSAPPSDLSTTGQKSTAGPSSNHNLAASTTTQAELEFLNEIFSAEGTGFADPFDANTRLNTTKSAAMTETNPASSVKVDSPTVLVCHLWSRWNPFKNLSQTTIASTMVRATVAEGHTLMQSSSFCKIQRPPSRPQNAGYLASSCPMHMTALMYARPHLATVELPVLQHSLKIFSTYGYVMQAVQSGQMQHRQGTSQHSGSTARIFLSHREKVSKRLYLCLHVAMPGENADL